jgi:hypothetical protein
VLVESGAVETPEHSLRKIFAGRVNRLHGNDLKSLRGKDVAAEPCPVPASKRILEQYDVASNHRIPLSKAQTSRN